MKIHVYEYNLQPPKNNTNKETPKENIHLEKLVSNRTARLNEFSDCNKELKVKFGLDP